MALPTLPPADTQHNERINKYIAWEGRKEGERTREEGKEKDGGRKEGRKGGMNKTRKKPLGSKKNPSFLISRNK